MASSRLRFALCADDYGLAPGVGTAVRDLIARGRLSGTSCMVGGPFWAEEAALLKSLAGHADLGLHFTLTDQTPCAALPVLAPHGRLPALSSLIRRSLLGPLPAAEVRAELESQLDRFEDAIGRPPDYIDGHHHVHQLPGVRWVLAELYDERLRPLGVRIRRCLEPWGEILRCRVAVRRSLAVSALGFGWDRLGLPGNRHFKGVRDFDPGESYPDLFAAWLENLRPGTLIMCHPGQVDEALRQRDSLTDPREGEYAFLGGDAFPDLLEGAGAELARFTEL